MNPTGGATVKGTVGGNDSAIIEVVDNDPIGAPFAGDVNTIFDPGVGADNPVNAIVMEPPSGDGRVAIAGEFSSIENNNRSRVARLFRTGGIDTDFLNNLTGANNTIHALAVQQRPDAGTFTPSAPLNIPGGVASAIAVANLNPAS